MNAKKLWLWVSLILLVAVIGGCATPTPETVIVKETVEVEVPVEKTVVVKETVEKMVEKTVVVKETVEVEVTQPPEDVTIKVMSWSQEQVDFYEAVAAEFNKAYPWITVEFETMAQAQYRETLPLMFQSGDAPDIFFWIGGNRVLTMAELYDLGWIQRLSPTGSVPDDWKARWPEGSFLEGVNMINCVVYSFPFNDNLIWGAGYMHMNADVFAAAGLDANAPPTTWSELRETCRTIKDATGAYCLAVPLKGKDLQRTWYPLAGASMSDQFFDYKNGRFSIDDPNMLAAFDFLQSLYAEDLVVPGVEDKAFARTAMAAGEAAIYFGGAWMPGVFKSMGFEDLNLVVAAAPVPDEGKRGALAQMPSENKFFVSSQTAHPEAAWLFLEWMTRPDGFFASEYLAQGFGTLAFADNGKYITDPGMLQVVAASEGLRVAYPQPVVACPDVALSKAYLNAENHHKNWEWEAMVEALTSGSDFAPVAEEIAATKNEIFQETLEAEAAEGLNVCMACWAYPEWDYDQDYDVSQYDKHTCEE